MQKRQILINAIMSVMQIIIISAVLFILYKFLLHTIGIEELGIWSLILASTSVTQIASFGLSASVVKFVAKYIARGEEENVSGVIQTASLSVAAFVGLILLIGYPIAKWVLGLVIPNEFLPLALSILPYSFFALWIMIVTSIFQGGLDGYQRIDIRSLLLVGSAIINLLLCFILAPLYGLIGVAYARVIQNIIILISSWFLLKRYVHSLPFFPYKWKRSLFKEIIGYGINFQVINVLAMFYDPVTKVLLSKFGGLSMVGFYEMASRMIKQFRELIISANQVLVPAIADLKEKTPNKIQSIYLTSYQLIFYLSIPLYSLIIAFTPIISKLWIGYYESIFVVFAILLAIGWLLNTLNAPAYFVYLGIGKLRWNMLSNFATALLNTGLGILLGIFFDGIGVVVAWVVSLALGSSIVYLSYHIKCKIPLLELLPKTSRLIMTTCLTGVIFFIILQNKLDHSLNIIKSNIIIILSFSIVVFILLWLHPMRKRLIRWLENELLNGKIGI